MTKTFRAARTIIDHLGNVTNLQLQKLLYIAHMFHLGSRDAKLIDGHFEAWDYGPVEPVLYHKLKAFGGNPIPEDILSYYPPFEQGDAEFETIKWVVDTLGAVPASKLVAITHWDKGAWARHYNPGIKGIVIPDQDIIKEYDARKELSNKRFA